MMDGGVRMKTYPAPKGLTASQMCYFQSAINRNRGNIFEGDIVLVEDELAFCATGRGWVRSSPNGLGGWKDMR